MNAILFYPTGFKGRCFFSPLHGLGALSNQQVKKNAKIGHVKRPKFSTPVIGRNQVDTRN